VPRSTHLISLPLILILATLVHIDWHFARPVHHRLSLGWSTHWLFCIAVFAAAGWYIGRRWLNRHWTAAAWNVGLALFTAQVLEPLLSSPYFEGRLAYTVGPEQWSAFWLCMGAGIPALVIAVWFFSKTVTPVQHAEAP